MGEGSKVSEHLAKSFDSGAKSYYDLRKKWSLTALSRGGRFVKSYEFNAPSAASFVILGCFSNGKIDWKTQDRKIK